MSSLWGARWGRCIGESNLGGGTGASSLVPKLGDGVGGF